jgi:hypothetical protein
VTEGMIDDGTIRNNTVVITNDTKKDAKGSRRDITQLSRESPGEPAEDGG